MTEFLCSLVLWYWEIDEHFIGMLPVSLYSLFCPFLWKSTVLKKHHKCENDIMLRPNLSSESPHLSFWHTFCPASLVTQHILPRDNCLIISWLAAFIHLFRDVFTLSLYNTMCLKVLSTSVCLVYLLYHCIFSISVHMSLNIIGLIPVANRMVQYFSY